tara:strand:+ start:239 stop:457 length:219 start_codon:yes stop_codon:yes gene_type:complete
MAKKKNKKNKLAIIIAVGKPKGMAYGGMASGKRHLYASSGAAVIDNLPNKGLKALAKTEKGKSAVRNMGFDV